MVKRSTGPQNALPADDFTELPFTQMDTAALEREKQMARFSKAKEYRQLKEYLESRIVYFQGFLPNGTSISAKEVTMDMVNDWIIANTVIKEFKAVIEAYETAAEGLKNATKQQSPEA